MCIYLTLLSRSSTFSHYTCSPFSIDNSKDTFEIPPNNIHYTGNAKCPISYPNVFEFCISSQTIQSERKI